MGNTDDTPRARGGYTQTLRDEDRALLERLKATREARGLNASQAARQIGLTTGGYIALEAVKPNRITGATRDKLQAWLDNGTPALSIVRDEQAQVEIEAGWREIEAFAQVRPDDQTVEALDDDAPDPALEQHIREWQLDQTAAAPSDTTAATPVAPAPEAQGVILLDLLAYFPEFDLRWSDAVALRWFDTFDNLAALVANEIEALP